MQVSSYILLMFLSFHSHAELVEFMIYVYWASVFRTVDIIIIIIIIITTTTTITILITFMQGIYNT